MAKANTAKPAYRGATVHGTFGQISRADKLHNGKNPDSKAGRRNDRR